MVFISSILISITSFEKFNKGKRTWEGEAKAQVRNNISNGTKKDNSNLNMSKVLMLCK
jgi:hypothetical protein